MIFAALQAAIDKGDTSEGVAVGDPFTDLGV